MRLLHISLNHIKRRKSRALFLSVGMVISITTVVLLIMVSREVNRDITRKLDEYGANILILPKSDDMTVTIGGMAISGFSIDQAVLREKDIQGIREIKNKNNIRIISPKLIGISEFSKPAEDINRKIILAGIHFKEESELKKWWSIQGRQPLTSQEILIGAEVQRKYSLNTGNRIFINGREYQITGILQDTGSQDDHLAFVELNQVQGILEKPGVVSFAEIAAYCYDCPIDEIVRQASEKVPSAKITPIRQSIESKMDTMHRVQHFSYGISVIILIISGLIVFTNVTASVDERTREIGIFRAMGFRQSHIIRIILVEILIISMISGILGYTIGILLAKYASILITGVGDISISFDWILPIISVVLSVFLGTIAGIYPAYKAAKLDPVTALRTL